jgi:hypothetical protein
MGFKEIYNKFQIFYDKFDHGPGQYSEERVARAAEYHALMRKTDFMTINEYNNFNSPYAGKNLPQFVRYAPSPQLDGYYKVGFWGNVSNTGANWKGYLPTGKYFQYQLRCVKNFSIGAASGISFDFSFIGIIVAILAVIIFFCLGIAIRLPIAIVLTLIQFIVTLFA